MLDAAMNPILHRLYRDLEKHLRGVDASRMQLHLGADPARWSVQQTVEHLLMTYAASSENCKQRLDKGTGTAAKATFQQQVGQFVVCTLGLFPKGRKAPALVMPKADEPPASGDETVERARVELERLDSLAVEAERTFGTTRAITHPVLGPMSVHHWRRFHLVHGEHHLHQIGSALSSPPLPSSSAGSSGSTPSATGR